MENPTIGLALIAGILSFISPCVLPLVPAYIGYMSSRLTRNIAVQTSASGDNIQQQSAFSQRFSMLLHGLAFVAGFTIVFIAIGLMTTAFVSVVGSAVSTLTDIIGRLGGVIIIFFGLHFMGVMPKFFRWLRKKDNARIVDNILLSIIITVLGTGLIYWGFVGEPILVVPLIAIWLLLLGLNGAFSEPGVFWNKFIDRIELALYSDTRGDMQPSGREGLSGSAMMGVVFSAGWTPCIGPLLGTILTIAAQTGEVTQGVTLLAAYSLGLGIPFIITAVLLNQAQGILRRLQRHMRKIELISGGLLVIIGLLVASGQLQSLSASLTTGEFSDFTYRVEECGIGIFTGELEIQHVGSCMGGTLIPVSIGQTALGEIHPDTAELEFLFHGATDFPIDVELSGDLEGFVPRVTLTDSGGNELISNDESIAIDENKQVVLADYTLTDDALYIVRLNNTVETEESIRFRLKVREAQPLPEINSPVDLISSGTIGSDNEDENPGLDAIANQATGIDSIEDLAADSDAVVGLDIGNLAPDFEVMTDTGEIVKLSEFRGQVVLLNFWGTWCGPCRREMPEFQQAFEEHSDSGFTILAVAGQDTFEAIREFREEFSLTFPLALDEDASIEDLYGIQIRPSSFFLDSEGIIINRHFGLMVESQIAELLNEALATTE